MTGKIPIKYLITAIYASDKNIDMAWIVQIYEGKPLKAYANWTFIKIAIRRLIRVFQTEKHT